MNVIASDSKPLLAQADGLLKQGRIAEAGLVYEAILRQEPARFDAVYRLGLIRLQQQNFSDAANLFRRAAKIEKKSADAQHLLAIALSRAGALDEAVRHYRKALALQPGLSDAHSNLSYVLLLMGRPEEAAQHCQKALAINPRDVEARTNLATALHALKRYAEAVEHYRQALALQPNAAEVHSNLAVALSALNRHEEAIPHGERAVALAPLHTEAHFALANARAALGQMDAAIAQYEKLLALDPNHVQGRHSLAQTLQFSGRAEAALPQIERVLAADPRNAEALILFGNVLRSLGKMEPATAAFNKAIAAAPRDGRAYYYLTLTRRLTADNPHFSAMKKLAREIGTLSPESETALSFGLAKVYAELGEHEQSFRHLLQGNSLKRRQLNYREEDALDWHERIQKVFTSAMLGEKRGSGDPSPLPIFIIGMPRSGTTLVEQILASHPKVFGAGESYRLSELAKSIKSPDGSVFPEAMAELTTTDCRKLGCRYLDAIRTLARHAERITDKMPANYLYAGLIHLALPNARIVHLRRDPRDIALSCFSTRFGRGQEFSYDLIELGRYIRAYQKLMAHWRATLPAGAMLEVDYEEIVGDLAGQARCLLDYCGLPWDDAVLSFHATERAVTTASVMQVRQPIYSSSIGKWRHYEKQLQPLLNILQAP